MAGMNSPLEPGHNHRTPSWSAGTVDRIQCPARLAAGQVQPAAERINGRRLDLADTELQDGRLRQHVRVLQVADDDCPALWHHAGYHLEVGAGDLL